MKRHRSQVVVAVVCSILGFLLAYQYKEYAVQNSSDAVDYNNTEVLDEIEGLKKEKEELTRVNEVLTENLKKLEESATTEGDLEKEIKNQLDTARMQLGLLDAKGPGVVITMSLKSSIFGSNNADTLSTITDSDLVSLVNTLWFSKAEAISINGYRITPQTGIKVSGNYIWIGSAGRIVPSEKIVIKAIGDTKQMVSGLKFQELNYGNFSYYDIKIEESDKIKVDKTTQTPRAEYITTVEGNEGE